MRGAQFEALVRWKARDDQAPLPTDIAVPGLSRMLLAVLVSAGPDPDALPPEEEFAAYRRVISEMQTGLEELQQCYT